MIALWCFLVVMTSHITSVTSDCTPTSDYEWTKNGDTWYAETKKAGSWMHNVRSYLLIIIEKSSNRKMLKNLTVTVCRKRWHEYLEFVFFGTLSFYHKTSCFPKHWIKSRFFFRFKTILEISSDKCSFFLIILLVKVN